MSTQFKNKANITAIEFVPMNTGGLVIEVSKRHNYRLIIFSSDNVKHFVEKAHYLLL